MKRIVDASVGLPPQGYTTPFSFIYGQLARAQHNNEEARRQFDEARKSIEETQKKRPDDPGVVKDLALANAALGNNEEAIRLGKQAMASRPIAKDANAGVGFATEMAKIYAWAGEKDAAIEQLAAVALLPAGPDLGELQKSADWDDLRGDPRFETIVQKVAAIAK